MQFEYYSLPLRLDNLIKKAEVDKTGVYNQEEEDFRKNKDDYRRELAKCSMQQSVMQNLHLLLTTAYGEFPADETYGCGIWDYDFDSVSSAHKVKEAIRQSLLQSIQQKEKRLSNVRVELNIVQEELADLTGVRSVKKRIDILVKGTLLAINEKIDYKFNFFVGPLSY